MRSACSDGSQSAWNAAPLILRDGARAVVRRLRVDDRAVVAGFLGRLSATTRYQRWLSARTPDESDAARWAQAQGRRELALAAFDGPGDGARMVADCRLVFDLDAPQRDSELAIVVADAWQGRGLGRALLARLLRMAAGRGVRLVFGIALADNHRVRRLLATFGFTPGRVAGDWTLVQFRGDVVRAVASGGGALASGGAAG